MEQLLFLCHRIPYPPNKGDKITNFEMLKYFSKRYEVHVGTFIDDQRDSKHIDAVLAMCKSAHFESLNPLTSRLMSTRAIFFGRALTLDYYPKRALKAWCDLVSQRNKIARVFVSSTPMYQFVPTLGVGATKLVHYHDLDSDKWRQYSQTRPWPFSAIYRREAETLLDYEREIAHDSDAGFFVTPSEAALFRRLAPEAASKTHWPGHGLDHEYYQPNEGHANPYPKGIRAILFVGVLDYWPNEDAAHWFATSSFRRIRETFPDARFYVVGMNPTARVRALAKLPGVVVTGEVHDVRPYMQHAAVIVAPLRIARGIQNKALQGMAMMRPVVMSGLCATSLSAVVDEEIAVADSAEQFVLQVSHFLGEPHLAKLMGMKARQRVISDYSWNDTMKRIDSFFAPVPRDSEAQRRPDYAASEVATTGLDE